MLDIEMEDNSGPSTLPYDPDQNAEEKREVRREYRALQKKISEQQANSNDWNVESLTETARNTNKVFYKVKNPAEAVMDSALLLQLTATNAQLARNMKSGSGAFDIDDYISKLVTFMSGRKISIQNLDDYEPDDDTQLEIPLEWEKIGRRALAKSRRVPVVGFMLGPLSMEQKKRAPVKRSKLEKNKADERKPQELREEDISRSVNETTKNVATLEKLLDETGRINLFKFFINPHSFAQSVENIFYLSFLIRDGKVAFETDENGEPIIYGCDQPSPQDYSNGLRKQQVVFELDMATWEYAKEVFDIKEPIIPHREAAKTKLGNKWYG